MNVHCGFIGSQPRQGSEVIYVYDIAADGQNPAPPLRNLELMIPLQIPTTVLVSIMVSIMVSSRGVNGFRNHSIFV